jgi:uncharacterized protein (TIGR02118 family)
MIRVNVMYPRKEGARFDWSYYLSNHIPMVGRKLGAAIKGLSVEQGVAGGSPGTPPLYVAMAHMTFDSAEAFQSAFAPHATEIMADIPKYTSIEPVIQISDVKTAQ